MMKELLPEIRKHRKADHPILPLILNRWSPRAMSKEPLADEEIFSLFEAARWAPSSYNNQPWRFIYARRGTSAFARFLKWLVPFNQTWASQAALLVVIISRKNFEHNEKPSVTHAFDTGAAWENICLEAVSRDLAVHGMEGFDYQAVRESLQIPDTYDVMAMFAVGKRASPDTLPPDLQKKEIPSNRKKIEEIAMEGSFFEQKKSSKP
jgi:nitroreductase